MLTIDEAEKRYDLEIEKQREKLDDLKKKINKARDRIDVRLEADIARLDALFKIRKTKIEQLANERRAVLGRVFATAEKKLNILIANKDIHMNITRERFASRDQARAIEQAARDTLRQEKAMAKQEKQNAKQAAKRQKILDRFNKKLALHHKWMQDLAIGERGVFRGFKFNEFDFSGKNFSGVTFISTNFKDCNLKDCDLSSAKFKNCKVIDCDFTNSKLETVISRKTDFSGSSFNDADFYMADFERCKFSGCNFAGAKLASSDFAQCNLKNEADLSRAVGVDQANIFELEAD